MVSDPCFHSIGSAGVKLVPGVLGAGLRYRIARRPPYSLDSGDFSKVLGAIAESEINSNTKVEVLTNGDQFYEAELSAIRAAQKSVNLEAYIFQRGELTQRFIAALAERARAGVKVNVVVDSIGSFLTTRSYFRELTDAGGNVAFYNPLRWYTLPRMNNRTHRELIIIDGEVGFIGGAGFADHWMKDTRRMKKWRDTMFRVEGEAVTQMQSAFIENWLDTSGEVLTDPVYFVKRITQRVPTS